MTADVATLRTGNDHNTPKSVLAVIRDYAPIGLDPCSNPWSSVRAEIELSLHDGQDGLAASWSELRVLLRPSTAPTSIVFVNPPYGRGLIKPWVEKAIDEAQADDVETIVLVPCDPATGWSRLARTFCSAWGPWGRRIAFEGAGGAGAKQPSAVYHFGPNRFRFAHHFEPHLAFVEVMPRRGT